MGAGDDGGATQIKKTTKCWGRGRKKGDIGLGPFVPGGATTRDKRAFCPGSWLHLGQKVFLVGRENSQPAAHL